jgi:hypothetical protein
VLGVVLASLALGLVISRLTRSSPSSQIREAVRRYLAEPAVVYPICLSERNPGYARAGVYPVPFASTSPLQLVLHRSGSRWKVVAFNDYTVTGWLTVPDASYPPALIREPWCRPVPHTPRSINAALRAKRAAISTFGMTSPYVPEDGPPAYKPGALDFSADGGAIYNVRKWLLYGPVVARARASWDYNACNPSCGGDLRRTHVTFVMTLSHPQPCLGVRAYTTLTVARSSNTRLVPDTSWSLKDFCA